MKNPPPRVTRVLTAFGIVALAGALLCLLATFQVQSDISKAFLLGVFSSGLLGAILLFGFAKLAASIYDLRTHIDQLRDDIEQIQPNIPNRSA